MSEPMWSILKRRHADDLCSNCHRLGSTHYAAGTREESGLYCGAVGTKQFKLYRGAAIDAAEPEVPTPMTVRRQLWLNHGHKQPDLYGGPDDMLCSKCRVGDYVRAPFLLLVRQYIWQTIHWGVVQDLVDAVPKQTLDEDWWQDDLTHAMAAANCALDHCNIEGAELPYEVNSVGETKTGSSGPSAAGGV